MARSSHVFDRAGTLSEFLALNFSDARVHLVYIVALISDRCSFILDESTSFIFEISISVIACVMFY